MSTPESNNVDPVRLMAEAEQGFDMSHAYVRSDADKLRFGAAVMFEQGAGELLYEKLVALGITDAQIDQLAKDGLLEETLKRLAPGEMEYIEQRVQDIATDPHARRALANVLYLTDVEQGYTRND